MGDAEEVSEERYLGKSEVRGAGSYAEGSKGGGGRFGVLGWVAGGGHEGAGRGGRGVSWAGRWWGCHRDAGVDD